MAACPPRLSEGRPRWSGWNDDWSSWAVCLSQLVSMTSWNRRASPWPPCRQRVRRVSPTRAAAERMHLVPETWGADSPRAPIVSRLATALGRGALHGTLQPSPASSGRLPTWPTSTGAATWPPCPPCRGSGWRASLAAECCGAYTRAGLDASADRLPLYPAGWARTWPRLLRTRVDACSGDSKRASIPAAYPFSPFNSNFWTNYFLLLFSPQVCGLLVTTGHG